MASMCDLKWYLFCSTEYYQAAGEREGAMGRSGSEPGSLGQMEGSEEYSARSDYGSSFEDEPPLLQELGIDFELIKQKVRGRCVGREGWGRTQWRRWGTHGRGL